MPMCVCVPQQKRLSQNEKLMLRHVQYACFTIMPGEATFIGCFISYRTFCVNSSGDFDWLKSNCILVRGLEDI